MRKNACFLAGSIAVLGAVLRCASPPAPAPTTTEEPTVPTASAFSAPKKADKGAVATFHDAIAQAGLSKLQSESLRKPELRKQFHHDYLDVVVPRLGDLHQACVDGNQVGCWMWRRHYELAFVMGRAGRFGERSVVDRHCRAGSPVACALNTHLLDRPGGDTVAAITGLLKACRAGWSGLCVQAAALRQDSGLAVEGFTEEQATASFAAHCSKGFVRACERIAYNTGALAVAHFIGSEQQVAYSRACRAGDGSSCAFILGLFEEHLPPFRCDRCDRSAWDDYGLSSSKRYPGVDCDLCAEAACRAQECCASCAKKAGCCTYVYEPIPDDPVPAYRDTRSWRAKQAKRALTVLEDVRAALPIWEAGCVWEPGMCPARSSKKRMLKLQDRFRKELEGVGGAAHDGTLPAPSSPPR